MFCSVGFPFSGLCSALERFMVAERLDKQQSLKSAVNTPCKMLMHSVNKKHIPKVMTRESL